MSKLVEVNGKDYIRYITRFRNQEDLDEFALRVGLQVGDLHKNTTELYLPERIVKKEKQPLLSDFLIKETALSPRNFHLIRF